MKIQSPKLVCFSPTGTKKAIIQDVRRGINQGTVELIDITKPDVRKHLLQTSENELLVVGVWSTCFCSVKDSAMHLNKLYREWKELIFFLICK